MKHMIPAIITAAALLLTPQTAGAVSAESYYQDTNGRLHVTLKEGVYEGFLLITDGTVTQETIESAKGVFSAELLTEGSEPAYRWSDRLSTLFSLYGENTALWLVTLKPAYMEIHEEYCQDFTILVDGALDAVRLYYTDCGYGGWNGRLRMTYQNYADLTAEHLIAQLEMEDIAEEFYIDWRLRLEEWEQSVRGIEKYSPEYWMLRQAAGFFSDYEMAQKGEAYAAAVREIYSDITSVYCEPDFTLSESYRSFDGSSVWDGIGDCAADGEVNAQDAAMVLEIAAVLGAGGDAQITEEQRNAADVSRDDVINAADASAILRYAAARGSGQMTGFAQLVR